jgi:hypothetical protein
MTYKVVWAPEALADFWEIWTSSENKPAISDSVKLIEGVLSQDPLSPRHEIVDGLGTAIRGSIGVDFIVDLQLQVVTVFTAWLAADSEGSK